MKDIKTYIDESIFSGDKDVVKSAEDTLKQEAVDELLKYVSAIKYTSSIKSSIKYWARIELGAEGYEINCAEPYILNLANIPAKGLKYKISKFTGKKLGLTSLGGSDLTKIFTPDCEFNGSLMISWCNYLTSLEGCPKKVDKFDCSINPNLNSIEGAPRECKFFRWGNNGVTNKKTPKYDRIPTEQNIRRYLKSKSTVIDLC